MRRLMWFSLGFAVSCGLWAYGLKLSVQVPLVLLIVLWFAARRWEVLKPGIVLALGSGAGVLWFMLFSAVYLAAPAGLDGQTVDAQIQITDYSYETNYGCAADGVIILEEKTYQVRVYVNEETTLQPGDTVIGSFRFRLTAPDGKEDMTFHSGKGIFLLAYQRGAVKFGTAAEENWRCFPSRLRQCIRQILADCFPEKALGFVQALLIGDSSLLDYETDAAFQVSGVRHVIAVSGLHVSILFSLFTMVSLKRRVFTALLGFPGLMLFAAAAGFTPSVSRACIMCALMLLSLLLEKEYDGPTSLAFAALTMLMVNPLVITSVSFHLSAVSVAGIFLFYESANNWLLEKLKPGKGRTLRSRVKKWFAGSISMSLSATVLTVPLCAYYFGVVSLIGMVTNLLVLWVIGPVFCGILAVCGLFFLWQTGAVLLAKMVCIPVSYILWITKLLSKFPLAAVYTSSFFIVLWLILSYILFAVFLVRKNRNPIGFLSWVVLLLCAALLLSWYVPGREPCSITMLDVGQGQSILLQSQGRTFLVDCGGDNDKAAGELAARTLLGKGIESLDGVILTHYDRDHMGGMPYLLEWVDTAMVILPDTDDNGKRQLLPLIPGQILPVEDTLTLEYEDTRLTVFGPVYSGYSNENSLCILFETENCDILITGDRSGFGERMLLRTAELPDVDIIVAGHHGSGDSASEELLDAVTPETVLISVSEDNNYGHPDPALLQRLQDRGCIVYRTDLCGSITIGR